MADDLEAFIATTQHRHPKRILYRADFTPDLRRRLVAHAGTEDLAGHYGLFQWVELHMERPAGTQPPDYSRYWRGQDLPEGTTINEMGVAEVPSGFYHFWGYLSPLRDARSLSQIEDYPLEDLAGWDVSHLAGATERAHAAGKVVSGWVGHMYETAWQIRGYEQFLMDMLQRPAWAQCLLDRLAAQNMIRAVASARAGADLIRCGDDIANQNAMMFAPRLWREMMLSRWAKLWAAVKRVNSRCLIWYHSDGDIGQAVGDLVDAGVDIINPLQPECLDADEIYRRYGRKLTFDGLIGTQSTMPFGSVEDVRARVREVIDRYGRSGGLIISPTHVLEPEVPIANVEALFDECRRYGTFA